MNRLQRKKESKKANTTSRAPLIPRAAFSEGGRLDGMRAQEILRDKRRRAYALTAILLLWNLIYALGNLALGLLGKSYWFITAGTYAFLLALLRGVCMRAVGKRNKKTVHLGRIVGFLLTLLSVALMGSVILADRLDTIEPMHRILMIGIAAFTTAKTVLAIMNTVKARHGGDPILLAIRNISCADAAASILSLQRSMLVTFGEMPIREIRMMNMLTGIGACFIILLLSVATGFGCDRIAVDPKQQKGSLSTAETERDAE